MINNTIGIIIKVKVEFSSSRKILLNPYNLIKKIRIKINVKVNERK